MMSLVYHHYKKMEFEAKSIQFIVNLNSTVIQIVKKKTNYKI